jgi:hypothetical protein
VSRFDDHTTWTTVALLLRFTELVNAVNAGTYGTAENGTLNQRGQEIKKTVLALWFELAERGVDAFQLFD